VSVDVISSAPKYRAHLAPVWAALPDELRGHYVARDESDGRVTLVGRDDVALVAGYMDMRAARRFGYRRIALLEHGIGQSYSSSDPHLPGGRDRDPVGLFMSPNDHAANRDAARYPRARIEVVGSATLDHLPAREPGSGPVVAITWHWHYTRIPEMRSAFAHFKSALEQLRDSFTVIGHAHPQAAAEIVPTYKRLDIEYEPMYRSVFRRADVLIADNTSALFEFASTDRPVVVLNAPEYRRDAQHGLRFWDAADVGVQVNEPNDLIAGVREALEDSSARKDARAAALDVVYAHRSGAGARAAAAIAEWIH
jgi:hypothetical protein